MSVRLSILLTVLFLGACGASQQGGTTLTNPEAQQQAINEVTQLIEQHCQTGVHGALDHVASSGPLLIVGTAGEIIEGRPTLEEVNQSYSTRNVTVEHNCDGVQRLIYASAGANVVWVEEALRTQAAWPGFSVDFPSQRTMIFEQTSEGWRLRYYSLSVRLPDDQLDQAYAQPVANDVSVASTDAGGDTNPPEPELNTEPTEGEGDTTPPTSD